MGRAGQEWVRLCLAVGALIAVSLATLSGAPVRAQDAAQAPAQPRILSEREADRQRARLELLSDLRNAATPTEARAAADGLWALWHHGPTPEATLRLAQVTATQRSGDLNAAIAALDALVADAPGWAEAWNRRATLRFIAGDFEGSLADIDEVLAREPAHFGALSGQFQIYAILGDRARAETALRAAVDIHPFLAERRFLEGFDGGAPAIDL